MLLLLRTKRSAQAIPAGSRVVMVGNRDTATADVVVGTIRLDQDGSAFAIVEDSVSGRVLGPGDARRIVISFAPTAGGDQYATLRIPSTDPDGTLEVVIHGFGLMAVDVVPGIAVDPPSWDAGDVLTAGGTASRAVTVASTGTGALAVGTVTASGAGFSIADDAASGQSIAPGDARTVTVAFDPASDGAKSGTLTIPSDAGADVVVALSGVGVASPPPPATDPIPVGRFYLGRQPAPAGVTVADGGWDVHTPDPDRALTAAKGGPPVGWATTVDMRHPQAARHGRWIGPPMAAQTVSTTFLAYVSGAYRSSALGAWVTSAIRFGVWRAADGTIGWQPVRAHTGAVEPWPTVDAPLPRRVPSGPPRSWDVSLTFAAGDRLVVEAGCRGTASGSPTAGTRVRYGGSSSQPDVSTAASAQPNNASWIEFTDPLLVLP